MVVTVEQSTEASEFDRGQNWKVKSLAFQTMSLHSHAHRHAHAHTHTHAGHMCMYTLWEFSICTRETTRQLA